jgi:hypothetical protein
MSCFTGLYHIDYRGVSFHVPLYPVIIIHCLLESVFDRRIKLIELSVTLNLLFLSQSQFLFQLALPLVDGDDFHLCFSGIVGDRSAYERAGTAEPSGGVGERLHGREEADQRGTLSHLVFLPEGQPFFLGPSTLIGSAAEIILTH